MKKALLILAMLLLPMLAYGQEPITFIWDAHPQANILTGFRLYQSNASGGGYMRVLDISGGSTVTADLVEPGFGTYFWVLTAVGTDNKGQPIESGFSNEVNKTIMPIPPVLSITEGPVAMKTNNRRVVHIAWKTNKESDGEVTYARSNQPWRTTTLSDSVLTTDHGFALEGLQPNQLWEYVARSEVNGEVAEASGSFENR